MLDKIKRWARKLKLDIMAVYIASTDARTPRTAKLLALAVAGYALSPIDLIPDFIPILGLVDDLIIVPAGIALVVRLIPRELMSIYRQEAKSRISPSSGRYAAAIIVVLWLLITLFALKITLS